jgi:hypothetical protein
VSVIWYPLKDRATHQQWENQMRRLGMAKFFTGIYNGAGLFIFNSPMPSPKRCRPCSPPCAARWRQAGIRASWRRCGWPNMAQPLASVSRWLRQMMAATQKAMAPMPIAAIMLNFCATKAVMIGAKKLITRPQLKIEAAVDCRCGG